MASAISFVLTKPVITDVVIAVKTSRRIYPWMLNDTLKKIVKTLTIATIFSIGLLPARLFINQD